MHGSNSWDMGDLLFWLLVSTASPVSSVSLSLQGVENCQNPNHQVSQKMAETTQTTRVPRTFLSQQRAEGQPRTMIPSSKRVSFKTPCSSSCQKNSSNVEAISRVENKMKLLMVQKPSPSLHQLRLVVNISNYLPQVLYISGGWEWDF